MERPRLACGLPQLLNAGSQATDNVSTGERGLHGCGRQAALKIIQYPPRADAGHNFQPVKLWVAQHQHGMIRISECPMQSFRVLARVVLRHPDVE